jgi:hypothetical protein
MFIHATTTQIKKQKFIIPHKHNFDVRLACSFVNEIIFRRAQFYKGKEKRKDKSNLILEAGTHWDKLNSTWTSRTVLAYPGKLKPKTAMGKAQREVNLNRVLGRYSELVEPSYSNKMIVNFDSKCSGTYL